MRWLILTDNALEHLPAQLGACTRLQKLMLSGNRLRNLPDEMAACTRLELLRIAANRFGGLPEWLLTLPRLSWLAYAGNPCSDASEAAAMQGRHIRHIAWDSIDLHHPLGEGASGIIYRAHKRTEYGIRPVAVKLFKGALTSDGLPRSEKAACIAAGEHPNLIPVAGKIGGHPDNTPGLVMSLIDPRFKNLAGPPSLESCTRDVYADGTRFSLAVALRIARGIASAVAHLHAHGVMHGDLYAHNILVDERGECLLGDFGAATFLPVDDPLLSAGLQRIEVCAFGHLLAELLERCDASGNERPAVDALNALQQRCVQPQYNARPLFKEIVEVLRREADGE